METKQARRHPMSVVSLATSASICLYLLMAVVAEPIGTLAATTANTVVSLTVVSTLSVTCSSTVAMTTSTGAIPGQYVGTGGTYAVCTPITNGSFGYTLKWLITTGSGGYGTGHLNSNNMTGGQADKIFAYKVATAGTPETFAAPNAANPATSSRWAGRIKSASTTAGGAGKDWGTDNSSDKWLNIGTGSAVSLISRTTETSATGDTEYVQFKGYIGSSSAQPTGTYRATVIMSVVDN